MVLIMNFLKSKNVSKPRTLNGADQDTEGSIRDKGYDSKTQDEDEGGLFSSKKGFGGSSKNKKKYVEEEDSDQDQENDFVEEIVRDHYKKRSGRKGNGKGYKKE